MRHNDNVSTTNKFTKVSEWVNAGAMSTGLLLLEGQTGESAKAVEFPATRFNSYGNPYRGKCWMPKSQLKKVTNDFYQDTIGAIMWLAPAWLVSAKKNEGYDLADGTE